MTVSPTASDQSTTSGPGGHVRAPGHATASSPPAESASTRGPGSPTRLYLRASTGPVPYRGPSPGRSGSGGPPRAGQLQAAPADLDLGTGSTGEFTLTASGGPVTWSASTGSADVTLSPAGGTIPAGQQAVVTVTVSRAQDEAGQATITFGPGGQAVTVSWTPPPPPSSPPPSTPPPTPTITPTVIRASPTATPTVGRSSPTPAPTPSTTPVPPPTPAPTPTHTPIVVSPTVRD